TCPDDTQAFAEAVGTLRDEPALRQLMAFKSRQIAAQRPWEAIMAQLEGHYAEALRLQRRSAQIYPPGWRLFTWGIK
ncbi:MAG: hypothetical protein K8I30_08590, partial [Anaerolineae bacterium]|nr:hypothetical protein [Anaerolineae bacterium]